jgi:nickel/cobalt transporter (NicO) family protein
MTSPVRRLIFAVAALLTLTFTVAAQAQTQPPARAPFGAGPAPQERSIAAARPPDAQPAGMLGQMWFWLYQKQAEFHRGLIDAVKRFKTADVWTATWALALASFGYGIFHAAGPGHGKAIVASYVLADGRTVRRGVALSFLAAFVQALSALVLVLLLKFGFDAAGMRNVQGAEAWLETASWGLVTLVGAWLVWRQLGPWLTGRPGGHHHDHSGHAHAHDHAHHDHGHQHHAHDHDHPKPHAHAHGHRHDASNASDCDVCGHGHLPTPKALEGAWSWRRALALAFAIGIRPCTGAILVLLFAISQGLLWTGVFATFTMAVGTAITVSALAALTVYSRDWATRLAGASDTHWAGRMATFAAIAGSLLVFGLGLSFFIASLRGAGPL